MYHYIESKKISEKLQKKIIFPRFKHTLGYNLEGQKEQTFLGREL